MGIDKGTMTEFIKGFKLGFGIVDKEAIVLELDEWCFSMDEFVNSVTKYFKKQGKTCEFIDSCEGGNAIILVDGKKYKLIQRVNSNGTSLIPVQQVILDPI